MPRDVFITGATGYLGTRLSEALIERGHSVRGLVRPGSTKRLAAGVSPVIARLGCNAGTCHGAKEGKNGFKLSLRGYDPETDLRALTDDLASRRVNVASPDDSLMLLKAVAEVPHEGGRRTTADSGYYHVLRQWISGGAKLDLKSPRVVKLDRGLIAGLRVDTRLFTLVAGIVSLCNDLGAKVVAEGIETPTELEAVIAANARYGQGYLLARPAWPLPTVAWPTAVEPRRRPTVRGLTPIR